MAGCLAWLLRFSSHALLLLGLLGLPVSDTSPTSTKSSLPAAAADDTFMFTEPGRSFVEYLQPPLPPANTEPEVGHVLDVGLEFRTFIGSAPLLHRDPRHRLDYDVINSIPKSGEATGRHVTGCTREAEIRVQLKIGMLHVSAMYNDKHIASVTVGRGMCDSEPFAMLINLILIPL